MYTQRRRAISIRPFSEYFHLVYLMNLAFSEISSPRFESLLITSRDLSHLLTMPCQHKATCSWLENLGIRHVKGCWTTVEEVPDDGEPSLTPSTLSPAAIDTPPTFELPEHIEYLDFIGALEGRAIVEDEEEDLPDLMDRANTDPEIQELSALQIFAETLQKAHDTALEAECEQCKPKKHGPYLKNSKTTKWRGRKAAEKLADSRFFSIQGFLTHQKAQKAHEGVDTKQTPFNHDMAEAPFDRIDIIPTPAQQPSPDIMPVSPPRSVQKLLPDSPVDVSLHLDSDSESDMDLGLDDETENVPINPPHSNLDLSKQQRLEQQRVIEQILADLHARQPPSDNSEETDMDRALNQLNYKNFAALRKASAELKVKSKDPKLGVVLCGRLTAMTATLNLYLDSELSYTWQQASAIVARSQGASPSHAQII